MSRRVSFIASDTYYAFKPGAEARALLAKLRNIDHPDDSYCGRQEAWASGRWLIQELLKVLPPAKTDRQRELITELGAVLEMEKL